MEIGEDRVGMLVRAVIKLQGGDLSEAEMYTCGESICAKCHWPAQSIGQKVLTSLATAQGLWYGMKLACAKCGCPTGRVFIWKDDGHVDRPSVA